MNGKVVIFSDGFMVLSYLFGDAFAVYALIDKKLPQDSPYYGQENAAELVAQNIDAFDHLKKQMRSINCFIKYCLNTSKKYSLNLFITCIFEYISIFYRLTNQYQVISI